MSGPQKISVIVIVYKKGEKNKIIKATIDLLALQTQITKS